MSLIDLFQAILLAFSAVFLMEMGDKTQLTAFALSIRFQSPFRVLLGVITGLTGVTLIGVTLGLILKNAIDFQILKPIIALFFILGGILILYTEIRKHYDNRVKICPVSLDLCEKPRENCVDMDECELYLDATVRKGAFLRSTILMFGAELGDKTMLMALGLATQFDALGVFLGALLALIVVNSVGVFAGEKIAKKLPKRILGVVSGILFIGMGSIILLI
ncbi:MAG: TMEM165/GDT1 family protein [Candidatus Hodarchaeota archaeon]